MTYSIVATSLVASYSSCFCSCGGGNSRRCYVSVLFSSNVVIINGQGQYLTSVKLHVQ